MSPFGTVSKPAAGVCVLIFQPRRTTSAHAVRSSRLVFSPTSLHQNSRPNPSFQGGNRAEVSARAEEGNKGVRGVYWFGFGSLIECLEDKPGDIRYPSGQRMGG